jgi:hypothetical protein
MFRKATAKNRNIFIVFAGFLAAVVAGGALFFSFEQTEAGTGHNVSGWAWSDNIGWISFNCTDTASCGTADYGVDVNLINGEFSGRAWSDAVGWISFNRAETGPPPQAPYDTGGTFIACLDFTGAGQSCDSGNDDKVYGWGRALSACKDSLWNGTNCTGTGAGDLAGGWDGWIKLSDIGAVTYGVDWNSGTGEFEGWAWGEEAVGWVSFNDINDGGADHQVVLDANSAPVADMSSSVACGGPGCVFGPASGPDWETYNGLVFVVNNDSTDAEWNIVESRWSGVGAPITCNEDVDSNTITDDDNAPVGPGSEDLCIRTIPISPPGITYTLQLEVEDAGGDISAVSHPILIKQDIAADFECSLDGITYNPLCNITPAAGDTVYIRDISTASTARTVTVWNWDFLPDGGLPSSLSSATTTFATPGPKTIELTVTDDGGRSGMITKSLNATEPVPIWREISPLP